MNKIIVANWKMNPSTSKEAENLFRVVFKKEKSLKKNQIIICPPFPFLFLFPKKKNKNILLGAQNVSAEAEGSFTGEVSPKMLLDTKVSHVIVGHGESRKGGDTDEIINKKLLNLLKFKISPIFCIGERERDKEGSYLSFIENQIKEGLRGVSKSDMKRFIIAYEPIWAIGKSAVREATPEEFVEVKIFIRKVISDIFDSKTALSLPILYGGSINSSNANNFLEQGADGLLVGRDSVSPSKFDAILNAIK